MKESVKSKQKKAKNHRHVAKYTDIDWTNTVFEIQSRSNRNDNSGSRPKWYTQAIASESPFTLRIWLNATHRKLSQGQNLVFQPEYLMVRFDPLSRRFSALFRSGILLLLHTNPHTTSWRACYCWKFLESWNFLHFVFQRVRCSLNAASLIRLKWKYLLPG